MKEKRSRGIIKIKLGYNANSSSVSSPTNHLEWEQALAVVAIFVVSILLFALSNRLKKGDDQEKRASFLLELPIICYLRANAKDKHQNGKNSGMED